jgi:predicted HTH domain antitoxin
MSMPDPVSHQWADNLQAIDRRVIEDTVIDRYRVGQLSHRQVAEALGLDYWQTEILLKERGAALNYLITDLETDAATLKTILEAR